MLFSLVWQSWEGERKEETDIAKPFPGSLTPVKRQGVLKKTAIALQSLLRVQRETPSWTLWPVVSA